MILDLVQKINKSLQNSVDSFINENLFSVKVLREVGLDKISEVINKGFSIREHLNLRVLDRIKDTDKVKELIQQDNFLLYKQIISLAPYLKDQALETFFEFDRKEPRMALNLDQIDKLTNFAHFSYGFKDDDFECKIFNHFTGAIINTKIVAYHTEPTNTQNSSHMAVEHAKILEREADNVHSMKISMYQVMQFSAHFSSFHFSQRAIIPADLCFEFILNHEMAHASYPQIGTNDENYNEKNSDVSSIIKMIKNHDFTQEEAQQLCDDVIRFRSVKFDHVDHYSRTPDIRPHYTIDAVVALKTVLETEFDQIKELKDKEICRYSSFIIDEHLSNGSLIFGNKNHIKHIDHEYIDELANEYNEKLMSKGVLTLQDKINFDYAVEFFPMTAHENKMAYEDMIIQKMLHDDFETSLATLHHNYSKEHPNFGHIIRNTFQVYQENKAEAKLNLQEKFDRRMLETRVNVIKNTL